MDGNLEKNKMVIPVFDDGLWSLTTALWSEGSEDQAYGGTAELHGTIEMTKSPTYTSFSTDKSIRLYYGWVARAEDTVLWDGVIA